MAFDWRVWPRLCEAAGDLDVEMVRKLLRPEVLSGFHDSIDFYSLHHGYVLPAIAHAARFDGRTLIQPDSEHERKQLTIIRLLLDAKAKPDAIGVNCLRAIFLARTPNVAKLLISAGASLDVVNVAGLTPLMNAVSEGNQSIVAVLLEAKADANIENEHGETALDVDEQTPLSAACKSDVRKWLTKRLSSELTVFLTPDPANVVIGYVLPALAAAPTPATAWKNVFAIAELSE